MKPLYIIFLDIDGVLINQQSVLSCEYLEKADKPCVDALNRIVASTGALIVVSSDWRIGRTVSQLQTILADWGVEATVVGKTEALGLRGAKRSGLSWILTAGSR